MNPFSRLAPRPSPGSGVTGFFLFFVALGVAAIAVGGLLGGCASSPGTAATAPAKIGAAVAKVATPDVVQVATQLGVSELLQRAVKPAKQAKDAQLCTYVAETFASFDGTTVPTEAEVQAKFQKQFGVIKDPDFPLFVAVATDAWSMGRKLIPANASTATVKSYLDAVATGTIAGAALYLPATAEAP